VKSAVIYYSLTGNTSLVAKMIAERIEADIIKLKPEKEIPSTGAGKYFMGGKSVMLNEKPKLINEELNLENYDTLIIGTPIWAGSITPPINTFLSENVIKDKRIFLFATHSPGTNTEKCFAKMKEKLTRNRTIETVGFEDVKKMSAKILDDKVRKFCRAITE
jgi:flavodoxin